MRFSASLRIRSGVLELRANLMRSGKGPVERPRTFDYLLRQGCIAWRYGAVAQKQIILEANARVPAECRRRDRASMFLRAKGTHRPRMRAVMA